MPRNEPCRLARPDVHGGRVTIDALSLTVLVSRRRAETPIYEDSRIRR